METWLQFQDCDDEIKERITLSFNYLADWMQHDHLANLKQKTILSYFKKKED